jgi:hypothetical protein
MMKNLVIFMLVLGMTSVAGATYSAVAPVTTGNVVWDVVGDQLVGHNATGTPGAGNAGYGVDYGNSGTADLIAAIGPPSPLPRTPGQRYPNSLVGSPPNAGNLAFVDDTTFGWGGYDLSEGDLMGSGTFSGDWYVFDILGAGFVDLYDGAVSWVTPAGTLEIVPEPMTIALLGLGGLFLLRRRK